ncbi:MAG: M3 family oligoendopeptidase [Firmicutes bacterium]|nr:M3 family oligoendopeptidase [Bacillota bacterium]
MTKRLELTWDLDVIFAGGSESSELRKTMDEADALVDELQKRAAGLGADVDAWAQFLSDLELAMAKLTEAGAFIHCLTAQNVKDQQAIILYGRMRAQWAKVEAVTNQIADLLRNLSDDEFAAVVSDERNREIAFSLSEARELAADRMDLARELLATDLAVDGYHALYTLYQTVVGRMKISVRGEELSVAQAAPRFASHDRSLRQELFANWEAAWEQEADLIAHALNHLAGFRLSLYKHRGWDDVLKEPLAVNRIRRETLDAMFAAVESVRPRLGQYLDRKAKLLGADRLAWYDLEAPIGTADRKIRYDDAAAFIVEQFGRFSPDLARFARNAFENRWIEAEDRPNKRPGGFCTSFPISKQSRIFMTFSGTPGGQSTLAHELGHAYHSYVMQDLRISAQSYPMNLAETASTFAELIVSSAAIEAARDPEERRVLLANRLDDAVAYLMNLPARFLFESRFYAERAKGQLTPGELNALMEQAQREAYADSLAVYHPYFWASKLHFYLTSQPFYNFPYTFGYLFSAALYARAKAEGPAFADRYVALLRDTGSMKAEDLVKKHLGEDLTDDAFWKQGFEVTYSDLEQFLTLTE